VLVGYNVLAGKRGREMWPFIDQFEVVAAAAVAAVMVCVQKARAVAGLGGEGGGGYEPVFGSSQEDDQLRGML
jgi:hypothetical protein